MQWEIINLIMANLVIFIILIFVIALVIQAIFLGIGLGFVNGSNRDLGTTFVTALLMSVVQLIPCVGCFIAWYFIKNRHDVGWGGALAAWLLGGIIMIIVLAAIFLFGFGGLALLLGVI